MSGWRSAAAHRVGVAFDVLRERDLRRLQVGWTAFFLVDAMVLVALSVWAFDRGGVSSVGALGVARLLPGAVALPFGAWAADRFPRRLVVTVVFGAMSVTQVLIAAGLASDAPAAAVYGLVAASSIAATPYRSAHLALAPLVARTPAELVAMNVTSGVLEGLATFAGPAVAALLLLVAGPSMVVLTAAIVAAAGCLSVSQVHVDSDPSKSVRRARDRPLDALVGGLAELRKNRDSAVIVGCFVAQLLVRGLLAVLLVSVSFELLELGNSGVGWLAAAIGIGGIVGGFWAVALTTRRRLARPFAVALGLWGAPIAIIGIVPDRAVAVAALFTVGVANAVLDVSGFTLIQRLSADRCLGRVFGVLFTVGIAIGGVGAGVAPALVSALGLRPVLILVGAILPALALALVSRFAAIDRRSEPLPELYELFSGIPLFAPLPPTTIEKLAAWCTPIDAEPGCVIIREGERGDRFYAIVQGDVEVRVGGLPTCTLSAGDHFGEIALVRDVNRTATVVALSEVHMVALDSGEFLDALTSSEIAYGIAWSSTGEMIGSG